MYHHSAFASSIHDSVILLATVCDGDFPISALRFFLDFNFKCFITINLSFTLFRAFFSTLISYGLLNSLVFLF